MGTVISKGANGVGALLGNALLAPFKSIFGRSCEDVCSGTWDVACFIEHLCIGDLVKLLMVVGLCYIILMFFYLLFELGICQCVGKSLCKMSWAACKAYWIAWEDITCFLWYKLKNVKRVNHRRRRQRQRRHQFQDIEEGQSSSEETELSGIDQSCVIRKRKLVKERKYDRSRTSHYPLRQGSKDGQGNESHRHHHHHHHHHRATMKSREGSVRGVRSLRQLQVRRLSKLRREKTASFKRRRLE